MAEDLKITAETRNEFGKGAARRIRRADKVPAVIYGHGRDPLPLAVNSRELERLLQQITAGSTVIELGLDGRTSRTLIREIQRDPLRRQIIHVDFQELFVYDDPETREIDDDEDVSRLEGDLLDLEPVLRDTVVLALPFQPLCREDCPGLCAECGARLADDPEHQHEEPVDPRWAALQGLTETGPQATAADAPRTAGEGKKA